HWRGAGTLRRARSREPSFFLQTIRCVALFNGGPPSPVLGESGLGHAPYRNHSPVRFVGLTSASVLLVLLSYAFTWRPFGSPPVRQVHPRPPDLNGRVGVFL